uniref:C-type lectin domain-containing protein n=1 Tax=Anabas testudineus TaxID=64144 RepID=A0A7N6FLU7_ANATE
MSKEVKCLSSVFYCFQSLDPGWMLKRCKPKRGCSENKCYFFSTDNKSWMEANAFCLGQNSNLMSIQDIHERLWVRTQINKEIYWIGLNDQFVEGIWEWSDGSPFIEYLSYVILLTLQYHTEVVDVLFYFIYLCGLIFRVSDTGCKASLITGVTSLERTVVRWWGLALDNGMMRTATLRGNTSANMSIVSPSVGIQTLELEY